ncbi:glycerophosphodiester phosphodiesterase [Nocardioides sp. P5_C9_2]
MSRALRLLLPPALAVLVVLPLSVAPATATEGPAAARDFSVTAHRGGPTRTLGENTLAAFRHSLRAGATAIETDVRRTRDDELVVLHDSGLGRTTTCTGPIGAWTRRQLDRQCLERTGRKPIPHLEELLAFAAARAERGRPFSLMLELKGSNWSTTQVRRVVNLVKDAGLVELTALSSLRATALERVRRLSPRMGNQLIVSGWRKVRQTKGQVGGYNVPARLLTEQRVRRLHRQGDLVVGGYALTRAEWRTLAHVGADGVVTPDVTAYRAWLG